MPHPFFKSTLLKNIFSLTLLQGVNYLLPLITVPYLVRVLGPKGFGTVGFALAFIQYFVLLTDYGFNLSATKIIAVGKNDPEIISTTFSSVLFIKGIFLILSFFLLFALANLSPKIGLHSWVFYLTFLMVVGNAIFPIWLFQGLQEMGHIVWINILSKTICTGAIFIFVKSPQHINIAAGLQALGFLIAGILGLTLALKKFRIRIKYPGIQTVRQHLLDGWPVFLSTASISLYTNTNIVLLGFLSSEAQVGFYVAGEKIIKAVQGLIAPVSQAVYPHVNELASQSKEKAIRFLKKILRFLGSTSLLLSCSIFFLAKPIVKIILGDEFHATISILKWMSPLPLIIAISNVLGIQTMLSFGMNKEFSRSILYSSIINLFLVIPFTVWLQAEGTAITLLITELFVVFCMWRQLTRNKIHLFGVLQNDF